MKDWPPKKSRNDAGEMFWEVDLRPHDKRKYLSPKDTALGEAQVQRKRLTNPTYSSASFLGLWAFAVSMKSMHVVWSRVLAAGDKNRTGGMSYHPLRSAA